MHTPPPPRKQPLIKKEKLISKENINYSNHVPGPQKRKGGIELKQQLQLQLQCSWARGGGGGKGWFQLTRSTHSRANEKETLNTNAVGKKTLGSEDPTNRCVVKIDSQKASLHQKGKANIERKYQL